ncbi:hypothetical protein [Saccharothrix sp. 6-C]|uniref:hypothetical protein n=1 Tax=Saccharothrix sp. 6-C TaxID=2781735 RepID=UPI001F381706|nr:hypothetical protein [Saccharothrix sp. 6-C]
MGAVSLYRCGGALTDDETDRLAEAPGDLPLAIGEAATWRPRTGMQVPECLGLLQVSGDVNGCGCQNSALGR